MTDQRLSKTQRNEVFQAATQLGLDPAFFRWTDLEGKEGARVTRIEHPPTGAFLTVDYLTRYTVFYTFDYWPRTVALDSAHDWGEILERISSWLAAVKDEFEAPDMWAALADATAIPAAAARGEPSEPFTAAELRLLETGLAKIERYVVTTQPPADGQTRQEIHRRFAYLLDAAKSGARKIDWLNIFLAQMVSLVVEGHIPSTFYPSVMAHARNVLNAALNAGLRLLGT